MAEVQEESCREVHPPDQKVMSWLRACIAFGCASRHFPFRDGVCRAESLQSRSLVVLVFAVLRFASQGDCTRRVL